MQPPLTSTLTAEEQWTLLKRGVEEILPEEEFLEKLRRSIQKQQPLRVKLGLDPTAPDIHLGFAVVLRKLRQFQDLGHIADLVIGDFTATIGDPSGKSETRPRLSREQVEENARTYLQQLSKILDIEKARVHYNSTWLSPLTLAEVIDLTAKVTVARLLEREEFQKRLQSGLPLYLHEALYPLCQAYDSVALHSDVEMGGTDQRFNILMGRDLQREFGQEPQVAVLMPLLVGLDGSQKMSKSLGNYVGIFEPPETQFGKIMSIPDEQMRSYFLLCTDLPETEINTLLAGHPMTAKKRLAWEIVKMYHSVAEAHRAQKEFERVFSQREMPEEIPDLTLPQDWLQDNRVWIVRLVQSLLGSSANEARRQILGGGVRINGQKITDPSLEIELKGGEVLQVGRRRWGRIKIQKEQ